MIESSGLLEFGNPLEYSLLIRSLASTDQLSKLLAANLLELFDSILGLFNLFTELLAKVNTSLRIGLLSIHWPQLISSVFP